MGLRGAWDKERRADKFSLITTLYPRSTRQVPMGEDDEGADDEGPIEVFGVHRLEQEAPGTKSKSGYIGVWPCKSKKHP